MSCPHISGMAALLREFLDSGDGTAIMQAGGAGSGPALASLLRALILAGALNEFEEGNALPTRFAFGYGLPRLDQIVGLGVDLHILSNENSNLALEGNGLSAIGCVNIDGLTFGQTLADTELVVMM